jgi:hypothetical protein
MGAAEDIPSSSSDNDNSNNSETQVVLNVYDLTPLNQYTYWFGFGIFHSGIEGVCACLLSLLFWWFGFLIWWFWIVKFTVLIPSNIIYTCFDFINILITRFSWPAWSMKFLWPGARRSWYQCSKSRRGSDLVRVPVACENLLCSWEWD